MFALSLFKRAELRESIVKWDVSTTKMAFVDLPRTWPHHHLYEIVVNNMLKAKAIERPNMPSQSYRCSQPQHRECLDKFLGAGLVRMISEEDDATHWRFTDVGLQKLVVVSRVAFPDTISQAADCTPLDQSLTTYELLDGMISRGWCWHFANPKNTQSYVVGQPKHIDVKPDARAPPFRNYLLVLIKVA